MDYNFLFLPQIPSFNKMFGDPDSLEVDICSACHSALCAPYLYVSLKPFAVPCFLDIYFIANYLLI